MFPDEVIKRTAVRRCRVEVRRVEGDKAEASAAGRGEADGRQLPQEAFAVRVAMWWRREDVVEQCAEEAIAEDDGGFEKGERLAFAQDAGGHESRVGIDGGGGGECAAALAWNGAPIGRCRTTSASCASRARAESTQGW